MLFSPQHFSCHVHIFHSQTDPNTPQLSDTPEVTSQTLSTCLDTLLTGILDLTETPLFCLSRPLSNLRLPLAGERARSLALSEFLSLARQSQSKQKTPMQVSFSPSLPPSSLSPLSLSLPRSPSLSPSLSLSPVYSLHLSLSWEWEYRFNNLSLSLSLFLSLALALSPPPLPFSLNPSISLSLSLSSASKRQPATGSASSPRSAPGLQAPVIPCFGGEGQGGEGGGERER